MFVLLIVTQVFDMVLICVTLYCLSALSVYISSRKKHSPPLGHWEGGLGWVAGLAGWAGLG